MNNIAIILSGGIGTRMGLDIPKQYILVKGKPILHYCIKTFLDNEKIGKLVICCADEWRDFIERYLSEIKVNKEIFYSLPGETRQMTIFNALNILDGMCGDEDIVVIHDGVRPLVSHELINRCIDECEGHDGILPVIRMKDTIYLSEDGRNIKDLLDRNQLFAGQAPEAFKYRKYIDVHRSMPRREILKISGSTEIAYKCGLEVALIKGDEMNFKITTPEDLSNFGNIISNEG